MLMGMYKAL